MIRRAWIVVLTIIGVLGFSARARAEDPRSVVVVVEGPASGEVAKSFGAHVAPPYTVDDPTAFRAALARRGTRSLAPALRGGAPNTDLIAHARAAAADAHVDTAVLLVVGKRQRDRHVHVWIVNAREGAAGGVDTDVTIAPAAGSSAVADAVWKKVSADSFPPVSGSKAEPPAKNEPTAEEQVALYDEAPKAIILPPSSSQPRDSVAASNVEPRNGPPRTKALLVAEPGIGVGLRSYSLTDRRTGSLRPYDLPVAPVLSLAVEVYPFARTGMPIFEGLGITAGYARAIAVDSKDSAGKRVDTSWQSYDIGLRERLMAGPVLVSVSFGYGAIDFELGDLGPSAQLPTVAYRFLQPGLEGRVFLGKVSVFAGAAYLGALSTGKVGDDFPRASVGGIAARLGAGVSITENLEVYLGGSYTRFFYSFHPEPGDANVAGGALDQMLRVSAGLAVVL